MLDGLQNSGLLCHLQRVGDLELRLGEAVTGSSCSSGSTASSVGSGCYSPTGCCPLIFLLLLRLRQVRRQAGGDPVGAPSPDLLEQMEAPLQRLARISSSNWRRRSSVSIALGPRPLFADQKGLGPSGLFKKEVQTPVSPL